MKNSDYVPEEHPEFEHQNRGDPIPTTIDRRRKRPQLLTILVILSLALSAFATLNAAGAFRQAFPQSQLISISFAYQFSNTGGNAVLVPGSTLNGTLTIVSGASRASTVRLSFNSTNPSEWKNDNVFGLCAPRPDKPLQMLVNGIIVLPENSDLIGTTCGSGTQASVTISPGTNTIPTSIVSDITASPGSFSLNWFANV